MGYDKGASVAKRVFYCVAVIFGLSVFLFSALSIWYVVGGRDKDYSKANAAVYASTGNGGQTAEKILSFSPNQNGYYRFETIYFNFTHPNFENVTKAEVKIFRNKRLFVSPVQGKTVSMRYNEAEGAFIAAWRLPVNPPVGGYEALLVYTEDGVERFMKAPFFVKARAPERPDVPLAFVMLEALGTLESKKNEFVAPDSSKGGWTNLIAAAKFMGADILAANVGETVGGASGTTREAIWNKERLAYLDTLAVETKRQGLDFGAWVHAFFIQFPASSAAGIENALLRAKHFERLGYTPSLKYETEYKRFLPDWHCSLIDNRRVSDVAALVKTLDKNPNVDYIGLDYIRSLPIGGLELVDDFVTNFDVDVPEGFWSLSEEARMLWLYRNRNTDKYNQKWLYYKAQKGAEIVNRIVTQSGVKKPLWAFTLGWNHGWEHGQDPLMLFDAGAEYMFTMLYEVISPDSYNNNIDRLWRGYASGGELNAIVGNTTVANLMYHPSLNPVEEYVRRNKRALDNLFLEENPRGVFFHDLWRANFFTGTGIPAIEWYVAGGKSFSDLRSVYRLIPVATTLMVDSAGGNRVRIDVTIENINTEIVSNAKIALIATPNITPLDADTALVDMLIPGQSKSVTFYARASDPEGKRQTAMIPILVTLSDTDHRERLFDFKYIRIPRRAISLQTNIRPEMENSLHAFAQSP